MQFEVGSTAVVDVYGLGTIEAVEERDGDVWYSIRTNNTLVQAPPNEVREPISEPRARELIRVAQAAPPLPDGEELCSLTNRTLLEGSLEQQSRLWGQICRLPRSMATVRASMMLEDALGSEVAWACDLDMAALLELVAEQHEGPQVEPLPALSAEPHLGPPVPIESTEALGTMDIDTSGMVVLSRGAVDEVPAELGGRGFLGLRRRKAPASSSVRITVRPGRWGFYLQLNDEDEPCALVAIHQDGETPDTPKVVARLRARSRGVAIIGAARRDEDDIKQAVQWAEDGAYAWGCVARGLASDNVGVHVWPENDPTYVAIPFW